MKKKFLTTHHPSYLHGTMVGCWSTLAKILNFSNHVCPWGTIVSSVMISTWWRVGRMKRRREALQYHAAWGLKLLEIILQRQRKHSFSKLGQVWPMAYATAKPMEKHFLPGTQKIWLIMREWCWKSPIKSSSLGVSKLLPRWDATEKFG